MKRTATGIKPTDNLPSSPAPQFKPRRQMPKQGSKTQAILTLTTTTPAIPAEIAQAVECSPSLVSHTLERYGLKPNTLEDFKKDRADIFAGIQERFIGCVTDETIKSMIAKRGLTDLGIIYDKERIERGLADANTRPMVVIQIKGAILDNPVDRSSYQPNDAIAHSQVIDIATS